MSYIVHELYKKLRGEVTEEKLFESSELKSLLESDLDKLSLRELKLMAEDLGSRLYYCSDTGEGRKVRRELEKRLREIDKVIAKKEREEGMREGKVPNPKASEGEKIKDLKEEEQPEGSPDEAQPSGPLPDERSAEEKAPDTSAEDDLIKNITLAKDYFEKGQYNVASELLKVVLDNLKDFKEKIKKAKEMATEEASESRLNEADIDSVFNRLEGSVEVLKGMVDTLQNKLTTGKPEITKTDRTMIAKVKASLQDLDKELNKSRERVKKYAEQGKIGESKVSEQEEKYTIVAKGISDEEVAKRIATDKKGVVVKDDQDPNKFKVIVKERFTVEDVETLLKEAKEELEALKKQKLEESKDKELEFKTLKENFEELVNVLAQVTKKGKKEVSEIVEKLEEKKKEVIEAIGNLAILQDMQIKQKQNELLDSLLSKKKEESK